MLGITNWRGLSLMCGLNWMDSMIVVFIFFLRVRFWSWWVCRPSLHLICRNYESLWSILRVFRLRFWSVWTGRPSRNLVCDSCWPTFRHLQWLFIIHSETDRSVIQILWFPWIRIILALIMLRISWTFHLSNSSWTSIFFTTPPFFFLNVSVAVSLTSIDQISCSSIQRTIW